MKTCILTIDGKIHAYPNSDQSTVRAFLIKNGMRETSKLETKNDFKFV